MLEFFLQMFLKGKIIEALSEMVAGQRKEILSTKILQQSGKKLRLYISIGVE